MRTYSRNKTLVFTRAEVKALQRDISELTRIIESSMQERDKSEKIVGESMIFIEMCTFRNKKAQTLAPQRFQGLGQV